MLLDKSPMWRPLGSPMQISIKSQTRKGASNPGVRRWLAKASKPFAKLSLAAKRRQTQIRDFNATIRRQAEKGAAKTAQPPPRGAGEDMSRFLLVLRHPGASDGAVKIGVI